MPDAHVSLRQGVARMLTEETASQKARVTALGSDPVHIFGFIVNITERKRTEERLHQLLTAHEATENVLREKLAELEQFEDVVVGRELKMMQLEKELERLKRERQGD